VASLPEVGTAIREGGKSVYDFGKRNLGSDTGETIRKAVKDHPVQTRLVTASAFTAFFPGLVNVPVLGVFNLKSQPSCSYLRANRSRSLKDEIAKPVSW
jgi:hypothetical protein